MSRRRNAMGCHGHVSSHDDARERWSGSGSNKDKYEAASAAVAEFNRIGIDSCVFGSLACELVGVGCKPNDVDIIVLDNKLERTLEEHKEFLVKRDRQFYLMPSRKRGGAPYRVLWYKTRRGSRVKVDVLKPGEMSIPHFMPRDIIWEPVPRYPSKIPMAPAEIVLLLKLQGWNKHRLSTARRYNAKQHADVDHICKLLEIGSKFIDCDGLPLDFMQEAQERVYVFVFLYPRTERFWRDLRFRVRRPSNST